MSDMVREGAVVIDVGINRTEDGKLIGDVEFEGLQLTYGKAKATPAQVAAMKSRITRQDSHSWKQLANAMERDLAR